LTARREDVLETIHRRKDGIELPVLITANLIEYEGQEFSIAFVQDISESKRAEEDLRKAQSYIKNIIESMPSMIIGVDKDGLVTQWNTQAQSATGILGQNAVGLPLEQTLPWISKEIRRVYEAIETRDGITETKKTRQTEGQTRYENITIYPLVTNGVAGAVIRIDDGTEKVQLEEMMIQSEKMLTVGGGWLPAWPTKSTILWPA
jgi:PAS domain S-box-containing protein